MTFQEDAPHGPMCAQRFAPAAECTCGKADQLAGQLTTEHPTEPLDVDAATSYMEEWLRDRLAPEAECNVYLWQDPDRKDARPLVGIRVAEVSLTQGNSGVSYMQTDMPWGIALCGQVERCMIALAEGWGARPLPAGGGETYSETDEEFDRLAFLIEEAEKEAT